MSVIGKRARSPRGVRKRPSRKFITMDLVVGEVGEGPSSQADKPAPTRKVRPYLGFDLEKAAYARVKSELLRTAPGFYFVFVGDEIIGPFPNLAAAHGAGLRQFGLGPLLIKQIGEEDSLDHPRYRS